MRSFSKGMLVAFMTFLPILLLSNIGYVDQEYLNIIFRQTLNTGFVIGCVTVCSVLVGGSLSWMFALYTFPFKRSLEVLLILGMVFPSYVLAFFYSDLFGIFGVSALILTMTVSTLPYVFMMVTMSLRSQSQQLVHAAMMLGHDYSWIKRNLLLPLVKPALIFSSLLVVGDTFSEFGATYFFGVDTVMTGIYEIWFGLNESTQGIRFSAWVFLIIVTTYYFINAYKKSLIGNQPKLSNSDSQECLQSGNQEKYSWVYTLVATGVVMFTVFIPVYVLIQWVVSSYAGTDWIHLALVTFNSSVLATLVSVCVLVVTTLILYLFKSNMVAITALTNSLYSTPGIILTITAIFIINQTFIGLVASMFLYVLVLKYLAMGVDGVGIGIQKISRQFYYSAKTLGHTSAWYVYKVQMPMSFQSYMITGILVWIDVIRELVIGLTLRPQWLDLLSVEIFRFMDMEKLSSGGPWILALVLITIVPIYWVNLMVKHKNINNL